MIWVVSSTNRKFRSVWKILSFAFPCVYWVIPIQVDKCFYSKDKWNPVVLLKKSNAYFNGQNMFLQTRFDRPSLGVSDDCHDDLSNSSLLHNEKLPYILTQSLCFSVLHKATICCFYSRHYTIHPLMPIKKHPPPKSFRAPASIPLNRATVKVSININQSVIKSLTHAESHFHAISQVHQSRAISHLPLSPLLHSPSTSPPTPICLLSLSLGLTKFPSLPRPPKATSRTNRDNASSPITRAALSDKLA